MPYPLSVPAKKFVPPSPIGQTPRDQTPTSGSPELMVLQLVPLFVERQTPLCIIPTKRFVPPDPFGKAARAVTLVFANPELTSTQLVPLLVDRKTPPIAEAKR